MPRIVVYRRYNDYIYTDGTLEAILELARMLDKEGIKWYTISY
jgi:hypothetical protein|tara:strand:+ start:1154 stop:1282 length:129 start_codon:yes stop_codon:yes gene_type:complete